VLQAAIELGKYAARDWIGEIDVPTSVVIHTRDQVVPPRRQFELASAVPGASARFVGADHFAVVREPQSFVRSLVDAINDVTFTPSSVGAMHQAS
jgi:3-oxoadipate enol-lactonase